MDNAVLEYMLSAAVPAFTIILVWCANKLTKFLDAKSEEAKAKTDNETLKTYIDIINDNAVNVVQSLNNTLVDGLKNASEDGKLTADEAIEIKDKAVDMLIDTLSEDITEMISKVFGDAEEYLGNVIEKTVCNVKNNKKKTVEAPKG